MQIFSLGHMTLAYVLSICVELRRRLLPDPLGVAAVDSANGDAVSF